MSRINRGADAAITTRSVAQKVTLVGIAALAVVLLGICGAMSVMQTALARDRLLLWVGDRTQSLVDATEAVDQTSRILVERFFGAFEKDLPGPFSLRMSSGN
jgi:methyl-accepting chemotaxis protein